MAVAARTANSTARLFRTGSAPGRPRQTGQMLVLGAAPNFDEQPQKALVRVSNCTWTSRPMTGSYLVRISGEMLAETAITGLILAAGRMKRRLAMLSCYHDALVVVANLVLLRGPVPRADRGPMAGRPRQERWIGYRQDNSGEAQADVPREQSQGRHGVEWRRR